MFILDTLPPDVVSLAPGVVCLILFSVHVNTPLGITLSIKKCYCIYWLEKCWNMYQFTQTPIQKSTGIYCHIYRE